MACQYSVPRRPAQLEMHRFRFLRNESVIHHWFQRAWQGRQMSGHDCFEPFIFTWIALNAWGECVTNQERDEDWVWSLALDHKLNKDFAVHVSAADGQARRTADQFRAYWPIPRVQVWRRDPTRRPVSDTAYDRPRFFAERQIPCEPGCALKHFDAGEEVPLNWEHFLPAVYRVRCNLFHGEKSPYNPDDAIIVEASFRTLVGFMKALGYFS